MSNASVSSDDRTRYGGQAVVEGVMMRSPRFYAVACRLRSSGRIETRLEPVPAPLIKLEWLNRPFLRGTFALVDAMAMGIRSLTYSANVQLEDELANAKAGAKPEAKSEEVAAGALGAAIAAGAVPVDDTPKTATSGSANGTINGITIGATTVVSLLLGIALFWVFPAYMADWILGRHAGATLHMHGTFASQFKASLIEGAIRLTIFFAYLLGIGRMEHVRRVFEYHGAEHKAINTLEAGLPLTVDNARNASRIHPRCGTNFIFIVLIVAILAFSFLPRHSPADGIGPMFASFVYRLLLLPIVAGISYEWLRFAGLHRDKAWGLAIVAPGLWTQRLTTREPDDSEIEVALTSLQAVWDQEHGITQSKSTRLDEPGTAIA